ncbi:MAG: DUF1016 N-terminal domain-containing protein, partial [Bacteroidales bacterium]|nr:DUF1016 N-terminal domain-containing protein [Bacteroidales bacterium]
MENPNETDPRILVEIDKGGQFDPEIIEAKQGIHYIRIMKNEKPRVVKIHDVQIDSDYAQWLNEIKSRYRSAQIKAAVKVNAEQLLFNWQLGRDLVTRKAEEQWGAGVVEQLSMDLQAAFPESKGFSTTNLWRIKQWYQFYSDALEKLPQLV